MHASNILILDDELGHGYMLQELLQLSYLKAEVIEYPQVALEALYYHHYALAVIDYRMPAMNGIEWMRKARQRIPNFPVMIISGVMDAEARMQASEWGANFIFEKPIDSKVLVESVKICMFSVDYGLWHRN